MSQNVLVTGAGKAAGLGFNLVLRYLEAAEILRLLFEKKREDFEDHRFITNLDEDYPF